MVHELSDLTKKQPDEELIKSLYIEARKTIRIAHTLTDIYMAAVVQARLLAKLYPWLPSWFAGDEP